MTRFIGRFVAVLALLIAATSPLSAQVDQGRALASIEACRELKTLVSQAVSQEKAPRLADKDHARLFNAALDTTLAGSGPEQPEGMALLLDMQREAGALIRAYLLVGIEAKSLASDLSGEQAARNFLAFLPELAELYDFRIRVGSVVAQSAALLPSASPDPVVSQAVAAIAQEQEKILLSAIAVASDPQIDPLWRAARLATLMANVEGFPRLLGKKKAQEVADRALVAAIDEKDNGVSAQFKDFALAMLR